MLYVPFLSAAGICVALFIYLSKRYDRPLVCPLNSDCEKVVRSRWSVTFGIQNEILGIGGFLAFAAGAVCVLSGIETVWFVSVLPVLKLMAAGAFAFTLFLIYVQLRVIREWCFWCLVSAAITITIDLIILL